MANASTSNCDKLMDLKSNAEASERGENFWNSSTVALKFDVEVDWQKRVRKAKGKPNYGMGLMDALFGGSCGQQDRVGWSTDRFLLAADRSSNEKQALPF